MSRLSLDELPTLPQGTPNPARADGLYPVLVAPGLFEELVDRVEWGEPDADGFYTPTLYREFTLGSTIASERGKAKSESPA